MFHCKLLGSCSWYNSILSHEKGSCIGLGPCIQRALSTISKAVQFRSILTYLSIGHVAKTNQHDRTHAGWQTPLHFLRFVSCSRSKFKCSVHHSLLCLTNYLYANVIIWQCLYSVMNVRNYRLKSILKQFLLAALYSESVQTLLHACQITKCGLHWLLKTDHVVRESRMHFNLFQKSSIDRNK